MEYSPTECTHESECRGTCPKCDAELAELQKRLEAKGIYDISEDANLNDLVRNYLNQDNNSIPIPGEDSERTEGMPMPLQGDIAVDEEGQVYVLSNVVGPIAMENNELKLPRELLKGKYQPDERVSQSLSDKLMNIFIGHQYS